MERVRACQIAGRQACVTPTLLCRSAACVHMTHCLLSLTCGMLGLLKPRRGPHPACRPAARVQDPPSARPGGGMAQLLDVVSEQTELRSLVHNMAGTSVSRAEHEELKAQMAQVRWGYMSWG